ncbi:MAG: methionine--tRNA ligase [Candidatus Levybacteria bacterium]|nr:methionine--tRNA ligase [Candidatus Levybacteria bacterium]
MNKNYNFEENAKRKFYITNAIPYVNAKPHVGHALEFVQSDVIARYHKLLGDNTLLLCGGDENAIKNVQAAEIEGKKIQEFVDENSMLFRDLAEKLNVNFDVFQKGSSPDHYKSSQELWQKCNENGDIYRKDYAGFYCVGCELFYEKDELNENGECFEHPGKPLQEVSESNYFFKLSKFQDEIKNLIQTDTLKITPNSRKNEMLAFIEKGLEDISISRSNARAKNWGVPVPGDDTQRMYVWFDALNIYRSGLGEKYEEFWPADVHVIGKGITRFHAIYWPAFLLSAKIPLPKSLFVHGYFTVNGQKMSKTLGNVIDPIELINKYGADALRYYFLTQIPPTNDGDFSEEKLKIVYNADLANGIGNLVARVSKLAEKIQFHAPKDTAIIDPLVIDALNGYKFNECLTLIWADISALNKKINDTEPWKLESHDLEEFLSEAAIKLLSIAKTLQPFLPETSEKILIQFSGEITSNSSLFPRIS